MLTICFDCQSVCEVTTETDKADFFRPPKPICCPLCGVILEAQRQRDRYGFPFYSSGIGSAYLRVLIDGTGQEQERLFDPFTGVPFW